MFDFIPSAPLPPPAAEIDPRLVFVDEHQDALRHAAHLLGGRRGAALVDDLAEGLAQDGPRSPWAQRLLDRLEALLGLENVHVVGSVEAAAFAAIDPGSPVVEEICLLLDGLRDARAAVAKPIQAPAAHDVGLRRSGNAWGGMGHACPEGPNEEAA